MYISIYRGRVGAAVPVISNRLVDVEEPGGLAAAIIESLSEARGGEAPHADDPYWAAVRETPFVD